MSQLNDLLDSLFSGASSAPNAGVYTRRLVGLRAELTVNQVLMLYADWLDPSTGETFEDRNIIKSQANKEIAQRKYTAAGILPNTWAKAQSIVSKTKPLCSIQVSQNGTFTNIDVLERLPEPKPARKPAAKSKAA